MSARQEKKIPCDESFANYFFFFSGNKGGGKGGKVHRVGWQSAMCSFHTMREE